MEMNGSSGSLFLMLADYLSSLLLPFACLGSLEEPLADMYDVQEGLKRIQRKYNKRLEQK